ncbi:MAG: biotin--[Clostridia bacterium]|nr:biotin--[acetyl-CoA-carboxylase] ligase [Clostridia bacterium]
MSNHHDSLLAEGWLPLLTTRYMGRGQVQVLHEATSTNTLLKQMALSGAPAGSLCLCETQTAGKGRLGRGWHSPAGQGLWLSVLLRPRIQPEQAPLVTLCAALAMAQAVNEVTGLDARIKWPNDLVLEGKKLCGILLEIGFGGEGIDYIVVGTGLNVRRGAYPAELAHQATSIEDHMAPPARRELLVRYLAALEETIARLEQGGFAAIAQDYRARSCTLGSTVKVSGSEDFTGTAEDIDETGALLVRDESGTLHRVLAGDVSVRGVMGYV